MVSIVQREPKNQNTIFLFSICCPHAEVGLHYQNIQGLLDIFAYTFASHSLVLNIHAFRCRTTATVPVLYQFNFLNFHAHPLESKINKLGPQWLPVIFFISLSDRIRLYYV